jgi:hypothetical protein
MCLEVSCKTPASGKTESACLLTAYLGRDAQRLPVLIGDKHAFDRMAVHEREKIFFGTVKRCFRSDDLWEGNVKRGCELRALLLPDIRHFVERSGMVRVYPAENLVRTKFFQSLTDETL